MREPQALFLTFQKSGKGAFAIPSIAVRCVIGESVEDARVAPRREQGVRQRRRIARLTRRLAEGMIGCERPSAR